MYNKCAEFLKRFITKPERIRFNAYIFPCCKALLLKKENDITLKLCYNIENRF